MPKGPRDPLDEGPSPLGRPLGAKEGALRVLLCLLYLVVFIIIIIDCFFLTVFNRIYLGATTTGVLASCPEHCFGKNNHLISNVYVSRCL